MRLDSIYYEEDVNWSLVVVGFETEFAALKDPLFDIERDLAHQTARHWRPMQYGAFTGEVISPSDSYVLKKVALYEAAIGEIGGTISVRRLGRLGAQGQDRRHRATHLRLRSSGLCTV
ncbi:DUF7007 domain-containing protein [Sphingomonas sp. H160509]|uniref:DUF7007 domain-containing protein n=1 Tax=Sphingomonas sp. H160509 TaxID=2955313 RepID=UPI00406C835B